MTSLSPTLNRIAESKVRIRGPHLVTNNENQPLIRSSSNLQIQESTGSPHSSLRASSEHSGAPLDPNGDRISRLTGSQENVSPPSIAQTAARPGKFILTLDGGGIRGYSTLLIIRELMKKCAWYELRNNCKATSSYHPVAFQPPHGPIIAEDDRKRSAKYLPFHYFDYIAGTSTGGLIAIMLSRLRMNVDECIAAYEDLGQQIFGNRLPIIHTQRRIFSLRGPLLWKREKFDEKKLEKAIKDVVDKQLGDSRESTARPMFPSHESRCKTIVVAVRENSGSDNAYLFRTYNHNTQKEYVFNLGPADNVRIEDVARATTAAPTYFKPKVINGRKYIDGGFCSNANNPSLEAYNEVLLIHGNNPDAVELLVSIGTGKLRRGSPFPRDKSLWSYYKAQINCAIHAATESENKHIQMQQFMTTRQGDYERFNVEGGLEDIKLGGWEIISQRNAAPLNVTLRKIEQATKAYYDRDDIQKRLRNTAEKLVRNRQLRSTTAEWEFIATGFRYHCTIDQCLWASDRYDREEALREHLAIHHADLGYRHPPNTDAERTLLEAKIRKGKILPAD